MAKPGNVSSPGCSRASRKTWVPGSRPSNGISGVVATYMSQTSESAMPITTPASTPAESTATIAVAATQKSNGLTRRRRRNSGMSIIPKTTASMMIAPRTAFGKSENSGASATSVRIDERAGDQRRERRAGAGRFVERAGGQARRDRHPAEGACRDVGHALRDRLLIDVNAVAVPRRERPGIAGRLREADQEQPGGGGEDRRVVLLEEVEVRQARRGQAARHLADERDTVSVEVEHRCRDEPSDHEQASR